MILSIINIADSNESSCPVGFHGSKCNQACGHCAGNGSCDQTHGNCYQGCLGRYFGRKCQNDCPPNCGGDGSCHVMTGNCKHGCKPGFFSLNCQYFCPDTCGGDGSCDINVPVCRNGCQLGHYGWLCQHRCSCLNGTKCERVSGNCLDTKINSRKASKQQSSSMDNIFKLTSKYFNDLSCSIYL